MARVDPSPNNDTQDEASPSSAIRPACPLRDIHAGDGVEIHIARDAHGIEELRYSPADAGEGPLKNAFVLVEVCVVEFGNFRMPENEIGERNTLARVECRQLPRRVQHEHLAFAIAAPGQGDRRGVKPSMLDEFRVGPKCQAADDRMQPVCPNDEIETTRTRTLESDIHPDFILGKNLDEILEDVLGVVGAAS